MSMQFTELVTLIEENTGTQSTTTSSYPLASKTRDINNAYANYFLIGAQTEGRWQVDDTNHPKYPIITTALTANQQDYTFTTDEQGNQILDIYRVEIIDPNGLAVELTPIDQFDIKGQALTEFMKDASIPMYYDKTANGIILYPQPNYTNAAGLKIYYNRTPEYFTVSDTTKLPGIPDMFHEYLAIRPSYQYCLRKGLPQTPNLKQDMLIMEDGIKDYYKSRSKDEVKRMTSAPRSSR